jgi:Methylmalonyl-CoA mutase, N-terminal domain/subunit
MYRGRPWTIRQYAGFASAEESNARYRYLLERGQTGLSIAFDLPTQLGYDSDDRGARRGRPHGRAIDSIADMEILLGGIPLGEVSTSMTINAPASLLLCSTSSSPRGRAWRRRAPRHRPERHPQGVHRARELHLPAAALDAADDRPVRVLRRADPELEHDLDQRLPHPRGRLDRGAGARVHARERDRLLRRGRGGGLSPDDFGARLSFFFNAHNDFFQEVAKFRAARRLWARIMRERFGATNPRALALRFHAQTGGSTLTAQQPENNIVRVAIQALSAVAGGAQSLHTNSYDEALALPTEHAARIALRTQQILAAEAGTIDTADPLGGSYYIESLTDELESRAWELIERVDEAGGAVAAVESGFVQEEIERAAFEFQQQVEAASASSSA